MGPYFVKMNVKNVQKKLNLLIQKIKEKKVMDFETEVQAHQWLLKTKGMKIKIYETFYR